MSVTFPSSAFGEVCGWRKSYALRVEMVIKILRDFSNSTGLILDKPREEDGLDKTPVDCGMSSILSAQRENDDQQVKSFGLFDR